MTDYNQRVHWFNLSKALRAAIVGTLWLNFDGFPEPLQEGLNKFRTPGNFAEGYDDFVILLGQFEHVDPFAVIAIEPSTIGVIEPTLDFPTSDEALLPPVLTGLTEIPLTAQVGQFPSSYEASIRTVIADLIRITVMAKANGLLPYSGDVTPVPPFLTAGELFRELKVKLEALRPVVMREMPHPPLAVTPRSRS